MLVQTSALTKRYGSLTALDDCTMNASNGEVLGLLGPNGSGKTTLLRLLLGYLTPTGGRATVDGLDCHRQAVEVHRRLTYLPGEPRMSRRLTGRDVLRFFSRLRRESSVRAVENLADRLQLDTSRSVQQMSTGMRQKLALAVTLAPDVPLVLLDEPTSNLDPTARGDVLALIDEARLAGKTVLFSSHVLAEVEEICDRVVLLKRGCVAETLRMSDVRRQHRIRGKLTGPLAAPTGEFSAGLEIRQVDGEVTIVTGAPLQQLLGWLAEQPLDQLQVEPVGLRTIFERHHQAGEE